MELEANENFIAKTNPYCIRYFSSPFLCKLLILSFNQSINQSVNIFSVIFDQITTELDRYKKIIFYQAPILNVRKCWIIYYIS